MEGWTRNAKRSAQGLTEIIARLPAPGEVVVNGVPILATIDKSPDRLEELLAGAAQGALKSRSERDEIPTQPNSGVQLELRVRRQIRGLFDLRRSYEVEKRQYELAVRLKDQAFERALAPRPPRAASRVHRSFRL